MAQPGPALAQAEISAPVKLAQIGSSDFDYVTSVFGEMLKRLGYNVEYLNVDYTAHYPALETGDVSLSVGAWETNWDLIVSTVGTGKVANFGSTGIRIREGWWYPDYVEQSCPGLPDWKALKEPKCVEALATADTAPKARFVEPPPDWQHQTKERVAALDLPFEGISSGSITVMNTTIKGAIDRKEPVMGWGYQPHWLLAQNPGKFVEFPKYEDGCSKDPAWGINPNAVWDCAPPAGFIWKLANADFIAKAPALNRLLHLFQMNAESVGAGMDQIDNGGTEIQKAANAWLDANEATWKAWIR